MHATVTEKVCAIRDSLAHDIGPERFQTWFGEAAGFDLQADHLEVSVQNQFVGDWIEANYRTTLEKTTQRVLGEPARVTVRVAGPVSDNGHAPRTPMPAVRPRASGRAGPRTWDVRPLQGDLDSYVVGPGNQLAFSAVQTVVRSLAEDFKPLVIHGGCGLGKTHLLQGAYNALGRRHAGIVHRYISGEEFTNEFVTALRGGRLEQFRARFRNVDLLLIDDLHFLANKKATQEEFLHTFNAIDSCGKQVVLTSDAHPRAIASLSEPLINRLISGMVVKIEPPDFATRLEILRRRAARCRCVVPPEVLEFVAEHVSNNVRELEGALYKLVALASLNKEPISLALARTALEDQLLRSERPTEAADIERATALYFGFTPEALRSRMRSKTVSLARGIAMHLIRKHTHMSFPEIGRMMGNKNHSTVLMANRRIERVLRDESMVSWITSSGKEEARMDGLLAAIERSFSKRRD